MCGLCRSGVLPLFQGIIIFFQICITPALTAEINDLEYFDAPGLSVLVFHNSYNIGKQSGIEIIQHGERVATNGYLVLEGESNPFPKTGKREVDKQKGEIRVPLITAEKDFNYTIRVSTEGTIVHVIVDLEKPLPPEWEGKACMNLELYPAAFFGKSFYLGDTFGIFPRQGNGSMIRCADGELLRTPMASGPTLFIAPEDATRRMEIKQVSGELSLYDGRDTNICEWFYIRSVIPSGKTQKALEWVIIPNIIENWRRKPVICHSQVGYHPDQIKHAIIELDARTESITKASLQRIEPNGTLRTVLSAQPKRWGRFLRYEYAVFDFSSIQQSGMYVVRYGNEVNLPFQISRDVYHKNVWQPTLEVFLPVQMCHVEVRKNDRVWHGACHLDDAMQAPTSYKHFDGYRQYAETETSYEPFAHIPGLNRGGWHDAGDYDLAAGSQASTTYYLTLAHEAFNVDTDQTRVELDRRLVTLGDPDNISDIVQQIENGVENLLTGYRISGHSYTGIIASTGVQYDHNGDAATITDNRIYDPSLSAEDGDFEHSGKKDDRYVFTNKDTSMEYMAAATLAAASRVLRGFNDSLANECLSTAITVWEYEQSHEPINQRNAYIPGRPENKEVLATAELLITTGRDIYHIRLLELLPMIRENVSQVGWIAVRTLPCIKDDTFSRELRDALEEYKSSLDKRLQKNPFGVPWRPGVWGVGWNIQTFALEQYYLVHEYPELFDREIILRALNFVLGCHPGSSTSFVSGVGARSLIPAYGANRSEWSYIPGGNASGTALIRPDFPELKEPFPFLWQQSEYVIHGAASYIFCVLAADHMLNNY